MDPLSIAVLITYYGERDLLRECLESIGNQAQLPDEILVYDDASDAPAEDYVPEGLPVKVLRGAINRGPAYGRNQLLEATTSSHIHFQDADDLFFPDWHERVHDLLTATQADAVFTEINAQSEDGSESACILDLQRLLVDEDLVRACINGVMLVPSGTYRRDAVLAMGGYRTSLWQAEDFDFHVRLAASGVRYALITDPLVTIRVRAAGRSRDSVETWCCFVEAVASLSGDLPVGYRADLADAAVRAGSRLFKLGARGEARAAFTLAERLGPPRFTTQRSVYRLLANTVGFETTEHLAQSYRRLVPESLRKYIGTRGQARASVE
jgi:glycosyltransferase involved in cell wall biosynthesis